jgi:hypothetical protein
MNRFCHLVLGLALCAGCTAISKSGGVRYLGNSNDIQRASQTPDGFTVSPKDAAEIAGVYHGPKKTPDDVYCDSECYYVLDGHIKSGGAGALAGGVKINGHTGRVYDAARKEWIEVRRSQPASKGND